MTRLRTAVIGAGHFGRYHAEKYATLPGSELVAVADLDAARAATVAGAHGVAAVGDHRTLFGQVDAVSVAVPTAAHFTVARDFLENGVHVLIEKPMTTTLEQADALIALARERKLVLQVGHLERFALEAIGVDRQVHRPLYIECQRIAPFPARSLDVSVVFDVMIHDIDMVMALVGTPIESVDAVGAPVLSPLEDIANARLRFADGCVANITASRVSGKSERKMRIFQPDGYFSIDLLARQVARIGRPQGPGGQLEASTQAYEATDTLRREIESFLAAVAEGSAPLIGGEDGRRALHTAMLIDNSLQAHRVRLAALGVGPVAPA